jgi:hypothetical protein
MNAHQESAIMTAIAANSPRERWWNSRTAHRFMKHHLALIGMVMIALLTLACVLGPHLLPYDSLYIDLRARFAPPLTGQHYLAQIRWGEIWLPDCSWRAEFRFWSVSRRCFCRP